MVYHHGHFHTLILYSVQNNRRPIFGSVQGTRGASIREESKESLSWPRISLQTPGVSDCIHKTSVKQNVHKTLSWKKRWSETTALFDSYQGNQVSLFLSLTPTTRDNSPSVGGLQLLALKQQHCAPESMVKAWQDSQKGLLLSLPACWQSQHSWMCPLILASISWALNQEHFEKVLRNSFETSSEEIQSWCLFECDIHKNEQYLEGIRLPLEQGGANTVKPC